MSLARPWKETRYNVRDFKNYINIYGYNNRNIFLLFVRHNCESEFVHFFLRFILLSAACLAVPYIIPTSFGKR